MPKGLLNKRQDLAAYRKLPVPAEQSIALRACKAFQGDARGGRRVRQCAAIGPGRHAGFHQ